MKEFPAVQCCKRIRILCPDLAAALTSYELLLGQAPAWQGELSPFRAEGECQQIKNPEAQSPEVNGNSPCAWFVFENCVLELLQADVPQCRIVGMVLGCEGFDAVDAASLREVHYQSAGEQYRWHEYPVVDEPGLRITLESGGVTGHPASASTMFSHCQAIPRVDHLVFYSNDADACIAVFTGLGIRLALDKRVPDWGGRMLFFRAGKFTLEVIQPNQPFTGPDYFWGLALEVTRIGILHQHLTEAGVNLSPVRSGRKPGTQVSTVKSHQLGIPTLLIEQD